MTMPIRFDPIPDDAAKVIAEIAASHGVHIDALFPDYQVLQKGDAARRDAARALYKGGSGYDVTTIAKWFGVSRVAINNAVKESR